MKSNDVYEQLTDPDFEMDMFDKPEWKNELKLWGLVWGFMIFVLVPWAVGCCMLVKWIVF